MQVSHGKPNERKSFLHCSAMFWMAIFGSHLADFDQNQEMNQEKPITRSYERHIFYDD